jgi:uncharacterized protein YdaU (DUF1376 family)
MAKDPAFLFYPNDWIGGTMGMTFEEKGAYMEVLMMQFNRGHMTGHMIGQVVGQLWDKISSKFEIDENGLYFNRRLELEQNKRKHFVDSRHNNKDGKNKDGKNKAHMTGHMTSHMENENINNNLDLNQDHNIAAAINFYESQFIQFPDAKYREFFEIMTTDKNPLMFPMENLLRIKRQVNYNQFKEIDKYYNENYPKLKKRMSELLAYIENTEKYTAGKMSASLVIMNFMTNELNQKTK